MQYFIFKSEDNSLHLVSSVVNENFKTDEFNIATLPEGEVYDRNYEYSYVDGEVVKGAEIVINEDELAQLAAEEDAIRYKLERSSAYPSIGDQLDALFHAGVFPEEMATQIQAVKDAYPKPQ